MPFFIVSYWLERARAENRSWRDMLSRQFYNTKSIDLTDKFTRLRVHRTELYRPIDSELVSAAISFPTILLWLLELQHRLDSRGHFSLLTCACGGLSQHHQSIVVSLIGSTPRYPVPPSMLLLPMQLRPSLLSLWAPERPIATPSLLFLI